MGGDVLDTAVVGKGLTGPRMRNSRSGGESWLQHPHKAKDEQGPGLAGHFGECWDFNHLLPQSCVHQPFRTLQMSLSQVLVGEDLSGGMGTFTCLEFPRSGCCTWHSREKVGRPWGFHSRLWISKIWDFRRCFWSKPQRVVW